MSFSGQDLWELIDVGGTEELQFTMHITLNCARICPKTWFKGTLQIPRISHKRGYFINYRVKSTGLQRKAAFRVHLCKFSLSLSFCRLSPTKHDCKLQLSGPRHFTIVERALRKTSLFNRKHLKWWACACEHACISQIYEVHKNEKYRGIIICWVGW